MDLSFKPRYIGTSKAHCAYEGAKRYTPMVRLYNNMPGAANLQIFGPLLKQNRFAGKDDVIANAYLDLEQLKALRAMIDEAIADLT